MGELGRPEEMTSSARRGCGEWLAACLRLGWEKDQLDALERIWWQYHDRTGALTMSKDPAPAETGTEKP